MEELKPYEIKLISKLLEMAHDEFSNYGCNDLDEDVIELATREQWIEMDKKYHELNGDIEEHDPEYSMAIESDSILMSYFAKRILDLLKE